jgi:Uma2 family endonuclease
MEIALLQGPFTVEDYHRMAEVGLLGEDDRVELIEGQVIQMSPVGSRHAGCVNLLTRLLVDRCGDRAVVAVQNPVRLSVRSEPQPDLSVLRPRSDSYRGAHPGPEDPLLVIEVADTTLAYDRGLKAPLYGRHGIAETWVVDLEGDKIEVHQEPGPEGYARVETVSRGAELRVPGLPGLAVGADEILG